VKKFIKILPLLLVLLLGFTEQANIVTGNWYQQFLPNLNNMPISDITFVDSLNGFAITGDQTPNDTNYILKTTNGGDNWIIVYRNYRNYMRIKFLNLDTGFVCGGFNSSAGELLKTTNSGMNWYNLNTPGSLWYDDMSILNNETIWLVQHSSLDGGVFYTTNGGGNWTQQFSGGTQNPNKIYMFNARIGFMSNSSALPKTYRTTNSGNNWSVVLNNENFLDMHFTDSLTGWKCMPSFDTDSSVKKTTDEGLSWTKQRLPTGGIILTSQIEHFSFINKDTIWGAGGQVFYGGGRYRAMLYRTTNGGDTWKFQIPDTGFGISGLGYIQFINKNVGWSYNSFTGIHTTNGGDTTFFTGIQKISHSIPEELRLFQNYPNPFNSSTVIRYQLSVNSFIRISVFDILGKHIIDLVNQKQNTGIYEVDFSENNYSSGVYFYQMINDDKIVSTKKMILLK
jgi:photosystem II stability/assembly factor-like uncharacterized protein